MSKAYSPELASEALALLEHHTVSDTCKMLGIKRSLFYYWKRTYPEFTIAVETAEEMFADQCADDALSEARHSTHEPQRSRLIIDTLMKHAIIHNRKKYGDRVDVSVSERISIAGAIEQGKQRVTPRIIDGDSSRCPIDDTLALEDKRETTVQINSSSAMASEQFLDLLGIPTDRQSVGETIDDLLS